jgi:hypothetical protein
MIQNFWSNCHIGRSIRLWHLIFVSQIMIEDFVLEKGISKGSGWLQISFDGSFTNYVWLIRMFFTKTLDFSF